MSIVKKVIRDRKKLIKMYALIIVCGVLMIAFRKMHDFSNGYTFLLWNTGLALIPLVLSSFLIEMNKRKYKSVYLMITGIFWILFLPNGPYLITDYKYIWNDTSGYIYQNMACLSWFILPGLFASIISLNDISKVLLTRFNEKTVAIQIFLICMITGFGVYIGIMRFNSWDVLHRPFHLLELLTKIFTNPIESWRDWMTAIGYGVVLYMSYRSVKLISWEFRHL